jgi:hypothetical protein
MFIYENIRDELKNHKYIIYLVEDDNKYKLILQFNGTKKELLDKIETKFKNKMKKSNNYFICYKFSFHTGTKLLQGGPLSITINTFVSVDGQLKNGFTYDKKYKQINGKVWFQKKFLEKFGWDYDYLDNMTEKLMTGKINLTPLVVNMYNVFFE